MRKFLPLFIIAVGFLLIGANWPAYHISVPTLLAVKSGSKSTLDVATMNLSLKELKLVWAGDCCSLPQEVSIAPFSYVNFPVEFRADNYGIGRINKVLNLKVLHHGESSTLSYPFAMEVVK